MTHVAITNRDNERAFTGTSVVYKLDAVLNVVVLGISITCYSTRSSEILSGNYFVIFKMNKL